MEVIQWRWPESQCVTSEDAIILWEGPTAQPTDPELVQAQLDYASDHIAEWAALRTTRNLLLTDCDWTQLGDAQLTGTQVTEWQTYRQVLRDLPSTTLDPAQPDWPIPPE
jgi:hypothetical protein